RGRQHPRRRRIRPALAPGRAQGEPPQGLRGLRGGRAGPHRAQGHLARPPRHPGRQQRRPADGQHAHAVPGAVRRGRRAGAAARHAALPQAAGRRVVDGRVRQPGQARGVRLHPGLLAVPPVQPGARLPGHAVHDLHARRPRAPRPRAQDDGKDGSRRRGRALLREHRGRPRRLGEQQAGRAHERACVHVPVERTGWTMMKPCLLLAAVLLPPTVSHANDLPPPPDAETRPHVVRAPHGAERQDEYYWLRDDDRKDPAMLAYLEAENAYADAVMAPLAGLQEDLYGEIVGRIKQDDSSVPYVERGWWYYSRFETGKDYPVHARRPAGAGVDALSIQQANAAGDFDGEQVLLDLNAMAEGKDYFNVGDFEVSQDNRLLAWAEDDVGRRQYVV